MNNTAKLASSKVKVREVRLEGMEPQAKSSEIVASRSLEPIFLSLLFSKRGFC